MVEGNQLPLFGGVSLVLRETPAVETSAGLCKANFTQFLKYKSSRNLFQPLLVVIGYVTGYVLKNLDSFVVYYRSLGKELKKSQG